MYRLVDVHKRYGLRTVALRKLNLEIRPGEFFVLYGPAGAGKSTILNLIAGITKPTAGDILRNGESIAHLPPDRRGAAMAFENYALYSHLSVFDNLAFPLRAQGIARAEITERVNWIAKVLGISHVLDRRPGFLSGGQRQRVALGRAIIRPAEIYLLDEPIGHLDAKLRHRMRAELKALAAEINATVVFTTTASKEALALADRLAVINNGRLEQVGRPAELYDNPANTFVASFVGDPPMSFLSLRAEQNGSGTNLIHEHGLVGHLESQQTPTDLKAGLRSRDITLVDRGTEGSLPGTIDVVEHLGYANIAVIKVGADTLSVSLPANTEARAGHDVGLKVNAKALHLFSGNKALHAGAH